MIRPKPMEKTKINAKLKGKNSSDQESAPPSEIIMRNNARKESKLSMSKGIAMLKGKMALGKYIFLISPSLLIKATPDCVTTELKKFQGIIPANKNTAKVFKSALNKVEKTIAITDIINSGLMSVHR